MGGDDSGESGGYVSRVLARSLPHAFFRVRQEVKPHSHTDTLVRVYAGVVVVCAAVLGIMFWVFASDTITITTISSSIIAGQECQMISAGPPRTVGYLCTNGGEWQLLITVAQGSSYLIPIEY